MIQIKICGLTREADIQLCAELGVSWVGFVFYPRSPRAISAQHAKTLHTAVPSPSLGGPLRVGLFVQPQREEIAHVLAKVPLDILQLYTSQEKAEALQKHFNIPVWLPYGIHTASELPSSDSSALHGFIIEAPASEGDTRPGGLGKTFDWSLTHNWHPPRPWLLAGGLTPQNVQRAIALSGAKAVDVSSGVENSPGHKSASLLKEFIKNARSRGCPSLKN